MWLINTTTIELKDFFGDQIPEYAILSHTWGDDEVLFEDVYKKPVEQWKDKAGGIKVLKFAELAARRGMKYVWVDTCCIDKRSSAELSEAINSMFEWYGKSRICYAYLSDVLSAEEERSIEEDSIDEGSTDEGSADEGSADEGSTDKDFTDEGSTDEGSTDRDSIDGEDSTEEDLSDEEMRIRHRRRVPYRRKFQQRRTVQQKGEALPPGIVPFEESRWFKRGWTVRYAYIYLVLLICGAQKARLTSKQLQELIAPEKLVFLNREWSRIGSRSRWSGKISRITRIEKSVLGSSWGGLWRRQSVHTKMKWARGRETTREEDRAYSLMGLFGVNMPLLYGEGHRAFERLFDEIIKTTGDQSILLQQYIQTYHPYPDWSPDAYMSFVRFELSSRSSTFQFQKTRQGVEVSLMLHPAPQLSTSSVLGIVEAYFDDDTLRLDRPALNLLPVGDGDSYKRGDHTIYRVRRGEEGQIEVDAAEGRDKIVLEQSKLQRRVIQLISSVYIGPMEPRIGPPSENYRILLRPIVHKSPSSHYRLEALCPPARGNWIYAKDPHAPIDTSDIILFDAERLVACVLLESIESRSKSPDLVILILESPDDKVCNIHLHLVELRKWIKEGDAECDLHRLKSMARHLRKLPGLKNNHKHNKGSSRHPRTITTCSYIRDLASRYNPETGASILISGTKGVRARLSKETLMEEKVHYLHVEVD